MPEYSLKCPACGATYSRLLSTEEYWYKTTEGTLECYECGARMKRDWKADAPNNNFKPSRDLYAADLKQRGRK